MLYCFKPANSFHFASVCRHPGCSAKGCGQRHHNLCFMVKMTGIQRSRCLLPDLYAARPRRAQPGEISSCEEPHACRPVSSRFSGHKCLHRNRLLLLISNWQLCERKTLNYPTALQSTFGRIASGPIEDQLSKSSTSMLSTVSLDTVTASLTQFWELEFIGIVNKDDAFMSVEEEDAVRQLNG